MKAKEIEFHLGITCAGGGTAGAYIAGVLDYLIETLDSWERKKKLDKDLPDYKVIIDVIGGNSAGSMSTALAVLNLFKYKGKKYDAVKTPRTEITGNLLYDSWVLLNNVGQGDILKALLDNSDFKHSRSFESLVNSKAIDEVADLVIAATEKGDFENNGLPAFVSENLDFLISLANLRGIPFSIKFKSNEKDSAFTPEHGVQQHKLIAHFKPTEKTDKATKDEMAKKGEIPFSPKQKANVAFLMKCAKSSATLPFIFKPRYFTGKDFSREYLEASTHKFTLGIDSVNESQINNSGNNGEGQINNSLIQDDHLEFHTVDGGTFNNEPFGEVKKLLDHQAGDHYKRLIMIDPYPTFQRAKDPSLDGYPAQSKKISLIQLVRALYTALRGQGLFKSQELIDDNNQIKKMEEEKKREEIDKSNENLTGNANRFAGEDWNDEEQIKREKGYLYKGLVFPSKGLFEEKDRVLPIKENLACAPFLGLSGFLSKKFRDRDFFLGRYNCQVFLHRYLILGGKDEGYKQLEEEFRPIKDKYFFNEADRLPIIPDMNFYETDCPKIEKLSYDKETGEERRFEIPDTQERNMFFELARHCQISKDIIRAYEKPLAERIPLILKYALKGTSSFQVYGLIAKLLWESGKKINMILLPLHLILLPIVLLFASPALLYFWIIKNSLFKKMRFSVGEFAAKLVIRKIEDTLDDEGMVNI